MKTIFAVILFLAPVVAVAQLNTVANPYPRTITVTGSAEMSVTPDEIFMSVTLKDYTKKGEAKKELPQLSSEFLSSCKAVGIPDSAITVSDLGGSNDRWYWKRKAKALPDMIGQISYEIKMKSFEKVEALADRMDEFGSSFRVSRMAHSNAVSYRRQLKIDAIKAAKEKARYLTEAIGEAVGPAVTITEPEESAPVSSFRPSQTMLSNRAVAYAESGDDAGITSRKIRYRYEVTVVFALK